MRFAAALLLIAVPISAAEPIPIVVFIDRPLHAFDPTIAFGATIDAHDEGENATIFTKKNVDAMLSSGFHRLSYRLMTELGGEAWHWNPAGTWSDPRHRQGYWTSSDSTAAPIELSYGYRLPRRGNTMDQAHNDGYSRIDDGDRSTFWKSNPYLDEHFAGEPRPQWVLADLGAIYSIDTVRIDWGQPYATDYRVQYWPGEDAIHMPQASDWADFPRGVINAARGGTAVLRVGTKRVRYIRLLMTRSSHTSATRSDDFRDRAGYAIRELSIGSTRGERFVDRVRHAKHRNRQTLIWVSSTDPWHRAIDRNPATEQIGFDAVYATGLTRGRPMLTPIALLYGTPEDSAAEVRYLRKRGFAVTHIEMGEEPDGQKVDPEDYAALYRQWARAIHAVDPSLQLGGPAFQSTIDRTPAWTDAQGRTSWIGRFVDDLREHEQLGDFSFFSFEWYPFDDLCKPADEQIVRAAKMLAPVLRGWVREGLPETIPWFATEYGYSSYAGQADVELHAAIVNAEFVAQFLGNGGSAAYLYGIEPDVLRRETRCATWGNLILFLSDEEHNIRFRMPAYWGSRLLTREWPAESGEQTIYETAADPTGMVTAYSLRRPDGQWSELIFNKSRRSEHVRILFRKGGTDVRFDGDASLVQYSSTQYEWHAAGEEGRPIRDLAPVHSTVDADVIELAPLGITVVRGRIRE
jgi:F5/8 type C domain